MASENPAMSKQGTPGKKKCVTNNSSETLTLRRLMSYIYIYTEHPFLMFLEF